MGKEEDRKKISEEKKMTQSKLAGRLSNHDSNPCLKEQDLTLECLMKNNNNNKACILYFENYKNCKSFWVEVQRHRRRHNITPVLPPVEEREKIKAEHRKLS